MIDFKEYKSAAKFASVINEGYSANLCNLKLALCPYMPHDSEPAQAWCYGWNLAESHLKGKS